MHFDKTAPITFSLLVPCYNAEKYVNNFIDNISKLSKPFNEVIFYDDASTDKTAELLQFKGLNVIRGKTNRGPGYARNRLAEAAHGDYIHFHDIDDEINPLFLDLVNKQNNPVEADVILGNSDWIDSETRKTTISWRYTETEIVPDPLSYFISHPLGIINTVYKKDAFLKINGFNEILHCWEDADLHIRLAMAGATFSVIDTVLAYSIRHTDGISKDQGGCWNCRMNYLEKYQQELDGAYLLTLGKEFEKTAYALLFLNQFSDAIKAFHHSRDCGYQAPNVNNPVFKILKSISPLFAFLLKGLIIKL